MDDIRITASPSRSLLPYTDEKTEQEGLMATPTISGIRSNPVESPLSLPDRSTPGGERLDFVSNGKPNPDPSQTQSGGRRASVQPDGRLRLVEYINSPQPLPSYSPATFSDLELAAAASTQASGLSTNMTEARYQPSPFNSQQWFSDHSQSRFHSQSPALPDYDTRFVPGQAFTRSHSAHMPPAPSWDSSSYIAAQFSPGVFYHGVNSYSDPSWSASSVPTTPDETQPCIFNPLEPMYRVSHESYSDYQRDISSSSSSSSRSSSSSDSPDSVHEYSPDSAHGSRHRSGVSRSRKPKRSSLVDGVNKPIPASKPKTDHTKDGPACWRCRRYKKSCDGPGRCKNCERGNFRVWPARLGCRRGCLEELVKHILPPRAAEILSPAARIMMTRRQPNWRYGAVDLQHQRVIEEQLPRADRWQCLLLKVQSTGMFGQEFGSLLDILVTYQSSQSRPNTLLENVVSLLDASCDIYHNFVLSAWPLPPADITAAIATAQRAYASVCRIFLTSTLSARKRDWLPSFLSMCMAFTAIMITMDAAVAVPQASSDLLWGSVHAVSADLRAHLFPTITDLLRASSNGTKPFALGCWSVTPNGSSLPTGRDPSLNDGEPVRSAEGMRMLGNDRAAFDGMRSLQQWIQRNRGLVELGGQVIRSDPFTTPEVPCIAPVFNLFDLFDL